MSGPRLTVFGHLEELRRRVLWCAGTWLVACVALWRWTPVALDALLAPLEQPAVFLAPADAFLVTFKLNLVLGALAASPVLAWHAASFLAPALKKRERRAAAGAALAGLAAFAGGATFALAYLLPAMMGFLMSYATDRLVPQIAVDRYFGFVVWTAAGCGIAAEFPVVTAGLAAAGIVTARGLLRPWRAAVLACFVIAAVVTPSPDMASMVMLAVPLTGLYLFGAVTAGWFEPRRGR